MEIAAQPKSIRCIKKRGHRDLAMRPPPRRVTGGGKPPVGRRLDVVIQEEFVWMGSQIDIVDLIFGFIGDPGVDDILGEHITL